MHLYADDLDVAHFCCALVNCRKLAKRNTELVLVRASRNVFMRAGIDIGIGAHCNRRTQVFRTGEAIDVI